MSIKIPRGTADILPGEVEKWQYMEEKAREIARLFNYQEIRTPIFEQTELFQRGVGETTDIVEKEMYTFTDRGNRSLTLRPEGTASVVRSYVENKMYGNPQQPVKLFYIGPMFRYERPQAGRMRQFHQFGVEAIGSDDPGIDAEVIAIPIRFYEALGIKGLYVDLNSVGCPVCRPRYREELVKYLTGVKEDLCEDCQSRLERNPMRVLDCKNETCKTVTKDAPSMVDHLCDECESHFEQVKGHLEEMGIPYQVNPRLVRGLDYYTRTAFEIMEARVGAVSTICGGGRYNGLVGEIGGQDMPGIGFAVGLERTLLALETHEVELPVDTGLDCYVIALGDEAQKQAATWMDKLRRAGISADKDYLGRKMKAQMKSADRLKARFAAILGEDELNRGMVKLKDMATGEEQELELDNGVDVLKQKLSGESE
ncbi:MAG: histidine--tRNA ligase [Bacillaceae bacterium]|nr:histidine--tRNA ligase [Bacillaceae bacterium]